MLKMFNNIWLNDQFPNSWKTAMIIPIHKQGKDPKKAVDYRPISTLVVYDNGKNHKQKNHALAMRKSTNPKFKK